MNQVSEVRRQEREIINSQYLKFQKQNEEVKVNVRFENVSVIHRSGSDPEYPNRPCLEMEGRIEEVIPDPASGHPYKNYKDMDPHDRPKVCFYYEFTDPQLAKLVLKGLYTKGFQIPEALTQQDFEMPVRANLDIVCFAGADAERILSPDDLMNHKIPYLPVYEFINPMDVSVDEESCGYDFDSWFPQKTAVVKSPAAFVRENMFGEPSRWQMYEHGYQEKAVEPVLPKAPELPEPEQVQEMETPEIAEMHAEDSFNRQDRYNSLHDIDLDLTMKGNVSVLSDEKDEFSKSRSPKQQVLDPVDDDLDVFDDLEEESFSGDEPDQEADMDDLESIDFADEPDLKEDHDSEFLDDDDFDILDDFEESDEIEEIDALDDIEF